MTHSVLLQPARQLVAQMVAGRLSAVELLEACKNRIEAVNPSLNALAVARWDEAHREAQQADRAQQAGQTLGPLHGLPITIKEMFDVDGLPTTAGIKTRCSVRVSRDAHVVRRLRRAGAIVVGKGNVPQLGMMAETDNPVYGRTNNPWNLQRGPGGSSGGEAALIAAGAVPLGLGSDGAGSIRQPVHACGICGFKPTGGRLPMQGHWTTANWPADWAQPGPMARHVDDLQLAMNVIGGRPADRLVSGEVPLAPADQSRADLRGLRVGVYERFAELPPTATVERAVREAAAALQTAGVELVPFQFDHVGDIWDLFTKIFYAEGLRDMKRQIRGAPIDDRVRNFFRLTVIPRWLRKPVAWMYDRAGQPRIAGTLRTLERPVIGADQYCKLLQQVQGLRQHFARQLKRQRVDALLGPASPVPAFTHGEFYANFSLIYTGIYNLLGVPAGVVPATRVRSDEVDDSPRPRDVVDQAMWRSQRDSAGLPVGVQVIGPWWSDDRVLGLLGLLQTLLSESPEYPHTPPDGG